jgi:hypothetical protein
LKERIVPRLDPKFLSEQECKEIATRQMLSFITLPDAETERPPHQIPASRQSLFSLDALPRGAIEERPPFFNWMSRDIYDVDGLLLFREQMLDLGDGNEWCVRVAASDLLRTPVDCIYGGPSMNLEALKERALEELRNHFDLAPLIVEGENDVRLVSYNDPSLGILCYSRENPDAKFAIKLLDLTVIPVKPYESPENPESLITVWSPYDIVTRSTIAYFRRLWERNMDLLPKLPKTRKKLVNAIGRARASILDERMTAPALPLIPQKQSFLCAPASAKMILGQHGIQDLSQAAIARAMHTDHHHGTTPENQVNGLNNLVAGILRAVPEPQPTFEKAQSEIRANLPFKIGDPGHARAVGGYRAEVGGKNWLYINDPEPTNQGRICCESWDARFHGDFMYVRPA